MPRVKKASPKKSVKNAATKSYKKKHHKEDASLHQAFTHSLNALENFWGKRAATLKKQLDVLRTKQEKASSKRKAAKSKSDKTQLKAKQAAEAGLQMELAQTREALAYAKLNTSKYAALSKIIDQHDKEWQKKLADVAPAATAPNAKKATKATKAAAGKKRGRKPKANATPDILSEETSHAFEDQDEEVIAKATKKRGRKSKAPIAPESAMLAAMENELVESLQDDEALEDDFSLEDELLIPLDEEFSELRIIDDSSSDLLDDEDYA